MSLNIVAYFQRGMSLNADKGIDHVRHGDRHERSEVNDVGATAGVSGRDDNLYRDIAEVLNRFGYKRLETFIP